MPLYEYECRRCGEAIEVRASIKERESGLSLVCQKCGSRDVRQRLTFASVLRSGPVASGPVCGPSARSGCCG